MATIRVFLLTYRRPTLLRRALESLRSQTFTDWICELHNDAPDDDFPRKHVEELADPRILLVQHDKNWGPVAIFNHACSGSSTEPFLSILEDDNWWEPNLLLRLHKALYEYPTAEVAWANMHFWQEETDGTWTNLNRTLWPIVSDSLIPIQTPQLIQFDGPLHSNGAMLLRATATESSRLITPSWLPFAAMENFRERSFRPPLILLTEPLANFAITRTTARTSDLKSWIAQQVITASEFISWINLTPENARLLWRSRREANPPATGTVFFAAIVSRNFRLLAYATPKDWVRFIAGLARHPYLAYAALSSRHSHKALAHEFKKATKRLSASANIGVGVAALKLARPEDLTHAFSHPTH